jgi:nucleotide-binding universal stress UspA family protein
MVLICYDGSEDARAAIVTAGELLGDQPATVLTVWQPFMDVLARTPSGYGVIGGVVDAEEIDEETRAHAEERAEEGRRLAAEAGLNAQSRVAVEGMSVAATIIAEAEEIGAGAIIMGSRGLTGLKSRLLGSVSHDVLQHADRAVLVVPSPSVASARAHERRAHERRVRESEA